MGLEAPSFIKQLVANWPTPQDKRREGDDHLRLIKQALKNTFPNMDSACTATPAILNNVPGDTRAIINELKQHIVPKGAIVMWSGAVANLPLGWAVCDGSDVPGYGLVPDLSDRFIIGFSTARPIGDTGGALVRDTEDAGSHNHPINGTTLTVAQMPNHTHRMWAWDGEGKGATQWSFGYDGADVAVIGDGDLAAGSSAVRKYLQTNADGRALIETSGAAQSHSHTTDAAGGHSHGVTILPKYYAMAFIIKTSEYEIE